MTMTPQTGRVGSSLIDELAADLAPIRPLRLWQGIALVAMSALATIALVELLDGLWRGIAAGRASDLFFIANGMFALVGAAASYAVLRMASPHVGNRHDGARWATAMIVLLPLTALLTLGLFGAFEQISSDMYGLSCFAAGTGFGLLAGGALVAWLRRGAPVSLNSAGLYTGIAAGAIGTFAYGLACPIDTLAHLASWHVLPIAVSAIAGRLIVPTLVRW